MNDSLTILHSTTFPRKCNLIYLKNRFHEIFFKKSWEVKKTPTILRLRMYVSKILISKRNVVSTSVCSNDKNAFCRDPIFIWQYQSCLRKQVHFYEVYKIIHFNCRKYLCALLVLAIYYFVLYGMCLTDKSGSVACCSMMILGIYTRFKVHIEGSATGFFLVFPTIVVSFTGKFVINVSVRKFC